VTARHKVVLYNPRAAFYTLPLALLAVGSVLDPDAWEVVIVDGRLEADPVATLEPHLDAAVCLGVTVLTGAPIGDALRISRAAKCRRPDLPVVWGGWHPSMFPQQCLEAGCVDVAVQGQGEHTFAEVLARLVADRSLEGCAGCAVRRDDGRIAGNPPRTFAPVASFREPDYGLVDVERYYALKGRRQLDYIASQGCNFRCAFCSDPFVYGRRWTGLDADAIGTRLEALWRRYAFDDLNFQDETFFTRRERVAAMAGHIIDSDLRFSWAATMRADQGTRLPPQTWERCRDSGMRRLLVGVESGSDAMLARIRKDTCIAQVMQTARTMRDLDVAGIFPFIVGFPDEPDDSVDASFDVASRLREMSPQFRTPFFYFKPYPGSQIVADAVARGYRLPASLEEWSAFDFVDGEAGPWVSRAKFERVERFKREDHPGGEPQPQ